MINPEFDSVQCFFYKKFWLYIVILVYLYEYLLNVCFCKLKWQDWVVDKHVTHVGRKEKVLINRPGKL